MSILNSLVAATAGGAVVSAVTVYFVKTYVGHTVDKRLSEFNHQLDKLASVSGSLYITQQKAIVDFDISARDFLGVVNHIVIYDMNESEIRQYWKEWVDAFGRAQRARFLGKLVFEEALLKACESYYDALHELRFKSMHVLAYKAQQRNVKFSDGDDPTTDYRVISEERFERCLAGSQDIIAKLGRKSGLIESWESSARSALRSLHELP